jgi:hypothetical protein
MGCRGIMKNFKRLVLNKWSAIIFWLFLGIVILGFCDNRLKNND